MKQILIIQGNPKTDSYCGTLAKSYEKGAASGGAEIRTIDIGKLRFDPNLQLGYTSEVPLEEDLVAAQQAIQWANHIVFVYPIWWGSMPAQLKGFIDRVFLPGFAFKYRKGSALWDKLLKGKSARLIVTMDTPGWYYRWVYKQPGFHMMKKTILGFCGITPVRITSLNPIKGSTVEQRKRWLSDVELLGRKMK